MSAPLALVTGSAGFVGRHMSAALTARGYDVVGVDIRTGFDCRTFFQMDARSFDLVVHCAAVVGGRTMIDGEPLRLAAEDLSIDAELFRWALRTRPKRMVLFSSSAAYPVALQTEDRAPYRLRESAIDNLTVFGARGAVGLPDATYGWVKLTLERLAAEANAEGIRTHVFRPFSGYGSDQDDSYPFPAIMRRALDHPDGVPFRVWGDPNSTRDWVHVDDVVNCVFAHIKADVIGPVNICTGEAISFKYLANAALLAAGKHAEHIVGDTTKPMGVFHRVGDPTLMREVYTPEVTIEAGIVRAMKELRS